MYIYHSAGMHVCRDFSTVSLSREGHLLATLSYFEEHQVQIIRIIFATIENQWRITVYRMIHCCISFGGSRAAHMVDICQSKINTGWC